MSGRDDDNWLEDSLKDAAREVATWSAEKRAAMRVIERPSDPLHPNGKCTCAGEGECGWCLRTRVAEVEAELAKAAEAVKSAYAIGRRDGLAIGAHRDALIGDVLHALAMHLSYPSDATSLELRRVASVWYHAGAPGAPGPGVSDG